MKVYNIEVLFRSVLVKSSTYPKIAHNDPNCLMLSITRSTICFTFSLKNKVKRVKVARERRSVRGKTYELCYGKLSATSKVLFAEFCV